MSKGIFALSLVDEGLWAVTSQLEVSIQFISQNSLSKIYSYIDNVLLHHSIKVTYAITTLFIQKKQTP